MLLVWVLLLPLQIGGQTSYVIVNGDSMEPMLHKGDLVLLREQPLYEVGDVVTYNHPSVGPVIHRIVARDLDRYVLQGDNNDWLDPYQPFSSELGGKFWFMLPGAGKILVMVRKPWILALISGACTLVIGMSMIQPVEPKKTSLSVPKKKLSFLRSLGAYLANWKETFWLVVYLLGGIGIILGIFAFTRPVLRKSVEEMLYQQTGFFTYTSDINADIYDQQTIKTGDPIYPSLGCTMRFTFNYGLHTPKAFAGGGSYVINARVSDTTGWKRTIPVSETMPFEGSTFRTDQEIDLCAAQAVINNLQETTGTKNPPYYLDIIPTVTISGSVAGLVLDDTFAPELSFIIDPQQVYINDMRNQEQDPFKPGSVGILSNEKMVANNLNIFQMAVPVVTARIIAVVLAGLAAVGAALALLTFKEAETADERLWAKLQIGEHMLETRNSPVSINDRIIDLTGFDELIQLAERFGGLVFFHEQAPYVDYFIRDDNVVYRHRRLERQYSLSEGETGFQQELLRALENDEFILQYQPIVSLTTGEMTQVEAFLRWNHPERGLLMPLSFLPDAEANGLIGWIDNWVLRTGCAQLRQWRDAGYPPFPMAIIISPTQLRQPDIADMVTDALTENGLTANALQIDISEKQFSMDEEIVRNLKALRKLGVGITISSRNATLLEDTPEIASQVRVNYASLQESLSTEKESSPRTWLQQAQARKVNVIAMGVETPEQLGFLRLNSCDEVQGFFVRPPLSAKEISQELEAGHTLLDLTAKDDQPA